MPIVTVEGLRDQPTPSTTLPEVSWAIAAGTADIITATYDPEIEALTDGLIVGFRATAANATTTPTFNAQGLGARTIVKDGGQALVPGDIPGALAEMLVRYNLANTRWELLNPRGSTTEEVEEAALPYVGTEAAPNLHLKNSVTDASNDMETTKGRCRSDDDTTNLRLAASLFKQLDVAWASGGAATGSPAGACDTGTKGNNQTWNAFLIGKLAAVPLQVSRTSNVATLNFGAAHGLGVGATIVVRGISDEFNSTFLGDVITAVTATTVSWANTGSDVAAFVISGTPTVDAFDVLYSQSATSPTMPAGWTKKQLLGAVLSDGSAVIRPFVQVNDEFMLASEVLATSTAPTASETLVAVAVPLGRKIWAHVSAYVSRSSNTVRVWVSSPDQTNAGPSTTAVPLINMSNGADSTGLAQVAGNFNGVRTDTSGRVRWRAEAATTSGAMSSRGWRDPARSKF